jgi:hypothetical protein
VFLRRKTAGTVLAAAAAAGLTTAAALPATATGLGHRRAGLLMASVLMASVLKNP